MTREQLLVLLRELGRHVEARGVEQWAFVAHGVPMQLFLNAPKDRMRVVATIGYLDDLDPAQIRLSLQTNFHSDARYGTHDDVLFAVFLRPLSGLVETELRAGILQVAELARSFGTTFSSGGMRFEWPRPETTGSRGVRKRTVEEVQRSVARRGTPVDDEA